MKSRLGIILVLGLTGAPCCSSIATAAQVWYVRQTASGGANTGQDWSNAFVELQSALAVAQAGDEIWVAAGTYLPDFDPATGAHTGSRASSFRILRPLSLYGGFVGSETDRNQRAPGQNVTILSGDIGQTGNASDNAYHVITAVGISGSLLIDGFMVTAGRADAAATPDCDGGGLHGGGAVLSLAHCVFHDNHAGQRGGAIYNTGGASTITHCIFRDNHAAEEGGAVFNRQTTASVVNCLFKENTAGVFGGAITNFDTSLDMVNCTLKANSAAFFGGGVANKGSQASIANSIFWSNSPDQIMSFEPYSEVVRFSCVQGGWWYGSNIDLDPLFWGDRLSPGSPAIDGGNNYEVPAGLTTDLDGRVRVYDGNGDHWAAVDMGAYELTDQQPTLRLTRPNGGETLTSGVEFEVTWQGTALTGCGVLELIRDGALLETIGTIPSNTGSLFWRVSDCLAESTGYSLRLTWHLDTGEELIDACDAPFAITSAGSAPSLRLTSPNGGETLTAGMEFVVRWEGPQRIGYGTLALLKGGVVVDSYSASVFSNSNMLSWRPCTYLPEGTDYLLSLTWYLDSGEELSDTSDAPFAITGSRPKPTLTLTSPNGGEVWEVGQTVAVTWTSQNATGQVYLHLYKGTELVASRHGIPMSTGTYEWALCNGLTEGNDYELKIRWYGCGGDSEDGSDAAFTVRNTQPPSAITLTSPNGGETIQAGSVHRITWTTVNLDEPVSMYLLGDGKYVQNIGQAGAGAQQYDWSVCPSIGDGSNYSIRIEAYTKCGTSLKDSSDGVFGIVSSAQPAFSVLRPIQGETLQAGAVVSISWSDTGQNELVTAELYKGPDRCFEIGRAMMTEQQLLWMICPTLPEGDDYSVVLTSTNCVHETLSATSGRFSIVGTTQSSVTVTSPNGGETIDLNQPLRVTWTSTNPQGYVSIELCRNDAHVSTIGYASMSGGSAMCYDLCPVIPAGCGYEVRIVQDRQCWAPASDLSDQPFEIVGSKPPPMIRLLSPNGGEILEAGKSYDVTWETTETFYVPDIWLETGGQYISGLMYEEISPNSVRIHLCPGMYEGTDFVLRISAWSCLGEIWDESDGLLAIMGSQPPPTVSITGPPAGTVVQAGDPITITWTANGVDESVYAGLYQDGDERLGFNPVSASQGSLTQEICEFLPAGEYTIRLRVWHCSGWTTDSTEVPITVTGGVPRPEVNLTSPIGGEVFQPGTTHTISWNATNPRGFLFISLTKGGSYRQEIGPAPMSAGQIMWKIDDFLEPGGDYAIELARGFCSGSARSGSGPFAVSGASRPTPGLTLLSPNGGEVFQAGSTQIVTWASTNPTGYVAIDLLQNGRFSQHLGDAPMADGRLTWDACPVGDDRADYSIRIGWGKYGSASVSDDSDGPFQIVNHSPRMSLLAKPDLSGQTIQAGTTQRLTWEIENAEGDLLIQLQKDGWPYIVLATVPKAAGQFDWEVCPMLEETSDYSISFYGVDCRQGDYSIAWSSGRFSIVGQSSLPSISITAPAGGDTWTKGSTQAVTWTTADPDADEVIEIQLESVSEEVIIQMGYANLSDGRFEWTVPESLVAGEDYRIKLVPRLCGSVRSSSLAVYSSGRFAITGPAVPFLSSQIGILAPVDGDRLVAGSMGRIIWKSNPPLGSLDAYLTVNSSGSSNVRYLGTAPVSQGFLDWQVNPCWVRDNTATYCIDLVGLGFSGESTYGFTIQPGPTAPTDLDGDCDADADDIKALEGCSSGPGVPVRVGCETKDLDHDGDVDQTDFGLLQACLSGPDVPADPGCLNR